MRGRGLIARLCVAGVVASSLTIVAGTHPASATTTHPLFVYVNNNNEGAAKPNSVSGYSVAADGSLTPVPGSPWATGGTGTEGGPAAIVVDNARGRVYVENPVEGTIAGF